MAAVTIYTKSWCPYCQSALALLRKKDASVTEISVDGDREAQARMAQKAQGRSTVPQIFIGETHVGGCDDLHALDARGGLDPLLAG